MIIKLIPVASMAISCALASVAHAQSGVLDVYTCYSTEKATIEGGSDSLKSKILTSFAKGNQALHRSGVDLQINPVGMEEVQYVTGRKTLKMVLDDVKYSQVVDFQERRKKWGADLVTFVAKTGSGAGDRHGPSNVISRVGDIVWIHEVGHNLGSGHHWTISKPERQSTSYSLGHTWYGDDGVLYKSVMIGGHIKGTKHSDLFSSPNLFYKGQPTGDAERADNVRYFKEIMHEKTSRETLNPIGQGEWVILNRYSGKAVHKGGRTKANGARLTQWTNSGRDNMIWTFQQSPYRGWAHIKNKQSNKVIDAKQSLRNGTPLEQWELSRFSDQQNFTIDHNTSGFVRIRSKKGNKIMHNPRTLDQGAVISQWSYNGATHLQYELRFVP